MPYQVCYMLIVSPTQWQKFKDWRKFAEQPSGTGPFRVTRFVPRERLELEANKTYWDAKRRPKIDKLVLLPLPEPTTRLAALRSGQVDWVEVPPPDSIPQLKGAGFQIVMNSYPHNWTHTLRLDKEPWNNKLVRKAANYAIDRVGICKSLLNDTCIPATGVVYKGHPVVRQAQGDLRVQPGQGQGAAQAGRLRRRSKHPAKAVQLISTSGSGQMLPLAMNELIQKNLKEVGIDVDLQPVEWNTLLTRWRAGFKTPENEGLNAWNISWNFLEPWSGFGRFFHSKSVVPVSVNTMPYINPEADKLSTRPSAPSTWPSRTRSWPPARGGRRRRAVDLRRARPEPTGAVHQGEGLRAAPELVRRSHGGHACGSRRIPCGRTSAGVCCSRSRRCSGPASSCSRWCTWPRATRSRR